jgi:hypothetical protein
MKKEYIILCPIHHQAMKLKARNLNIEIYVGMKCNKILDNGNIVKHVIVPGDMIVENILECEHGCEFRMLVKI